MKIRFVLLAIHATVALSCRNSAGQHIETLISLKAEKCLTNAKCEVKIRDLTDFEWEKMYAFNYPISLESIENAINAPYPYYEEFTRPLIFISKGKIVYHENNPSNVEGLLDGQVVFALPDSLAFGQYLYSDIFIVNKRTSANGIYYDLHLK